MNQIILCPKCNSRSWSSDYWICPNCSYSESKEWVLLEENKNYSESKHKGDNSSLDLNFWIKEQKSLCQEMVNDLLPHHNLEPVSFKNPKQGEWGYTIYRENDQVKAKLAEQKFLENGFIIKDFFGRNFYRVNYFKMWGIYDQRPTIINISPKTLITEHSGDTVYGVIGGVEGTGAGFLPTTAHESAHASQEVNHNHSFRPWINESHDEIWKAVYIKFFNKLYQKYGEKVKNRFIEYRKITKKTEKEY